MLLKFWEGFMLMCLQKQYYSSYFISTMSIIAVCFCMLSPELTAISFLITKFHNKKDGKRETFVKKKKKSKILSLLLGKEGNTLCLSAAMKCISISNVSIFAQQR